MKKPIRFIYFDVGGVLLDFRSGQKIIAKKYRVPHSAMNAIVEANWQAACRGVLPNTEYMAKFAKLFRLNSPLPDLSDFLTDHYLPISQTHSFVHELKSLYPLGILSNAEPGAMKHALRKGLIPDIVWASTVDSSEHGTIKPESKIYEIAEIAAGVTPGEIFLIDDVPEHVSAAQSRGWQGMVFDTNAIGVSIKKLKKTLLVK